MPVPIQTIKHVTPLRRAFALFGGLRLKLDETVVPVAIVEDLAPDDFKSAFVGDARGNAGVGLHHIWSLENPAASGKLVKFGKLICNVNVGMEWRMTISATPYVPGTIVGGWWQDLNPTYGLFGPGFSTLPSTRLRWTAANVAVTGVTVFDFYAVGAHTEHVEFDMTLHPGQSVVLWQIFDNLPGYVSLQWRERALEPTEK